MGELTDRALQGAVTETSEPLAPLSDRIIKKINSGAEFIMNLPSAVGKAYTGEDVEIEFPDLPEIMDMPASETEEMGFLDKLVPNIQLIMTRDDLGKAEILEQTFEGDEKFSGVFQDKFGHPIVGYNDKFYYINKPGATKMDVKTLIGESLKFAAASKFIGGTPGVIPKVVKGVPAYSATDFVAQKTEDAMTPKTATAKKESTQTDIKQALVAGAGATAADIFVPPALKLASKIVSAPVKSAVQTAARIKYPTLTQEMIGEVVSGASSQQTSKYPLTVGQRTNPIASNASADAQLRMEDQARYAASADPAAQAIIRDFDQNQLNAIIEDANALIDEFGTTKPTIRDATNPAAAATESIQATVQGTARDLKRPAQQGYQAVETGLPVMASRISDRSLVQLGVVPPPTVTGENIAGILTRSLERASGKYPAMMETDLLEPAVTKIISNFKKTSDTALSDGFGAKEIQFLRNKQALINGVIKDLSPDKTQTALFLGEIKRNLDQELYTGIRRGLIDGDPSVIEVLKKSNQLYRDFSKITGQGPAKNQTQKAANAILKDMYEGDKSAKDIAGMLFGHNQLAPKGSMKIVMDRLQSSMPEAQYASVLADLKTAILLRTFSGKNTILGDSSITRAAIAKNYNEAFDTNTDIVKRIFSPSELKRISQFRKDVLPTLWADKRLIQNPSGTGYTMLSAMAKVGLLPGAIRVGAAAPLIGEMFKEIGAMSSAGAAREAVAQGIYIANSPLFSNIVAATERVSPDNADQSEAVKALLSDMPPEIAEKVRQAAQAAQ